MQTYDITRTQYKIADYLSWQRSGALDLTPPFQRRAVWRPGAKSFLLDTVVRGLPTPIVFLRERIELADLSTVREVVDGQQRLRTLLAFVDPNSLSDYDPARDAATMSRTHNRELAGKTFKQLDDASKHRFLNYEFSTHVLPSTVDDREVLMIFSRLNSTGVQLNSQELRNARWFGEFKTLMYELALEQLDRWRSWRLMGDDEIARMRDAELTSDIVVMMLNGYGGKSQRAIDKEYETFDESFPHSDVVSRRFRRTLDAIGELYGEEIAESSFRTENWFIPLFFVLYADLWKDASVTRDSGSRRLPAGLTARIRTAAKRLSAFDKLPQTVQDAARGASTDAARRRVRLTYVTKLLAA